MSLLNTFLFATSMYGRADKLDHIAVGFAALSRSVDLGQNLQTSRALISADEFQLKEAVLLSHFFLGGRR